MASAGIDMRTGRVLTDFDHVVQSVRIIFSTRLGSRVMLRWFGSGLPELLGRRIVPATVSRYITLIALSIFAWEPRLQVVAVRTGGNTANAVALGELTFEVLCYYRPRGHLGDFTIEGGLRRIGVGSNDNKITVSSLAA